MKARANQQGSFTGTHQEFSDFIRMYDGVTITGNTPYQTGIDFCFSFICTRDFTIDVWEKRVSGLDKLYTKDEVIEMILEWASIVAVNRYDGTLAYDNAKKWIKEKF